MANPTGSAEASTSAATPPTEAPAAASASKPAVKAPPREIPRYLKPLQFMGIPRSVLAWQPKLPSRNWSIFIVTVSSLTYLYYDDRKQCRQIREEYCDKVRHLSQERMHPSEWPRKVIVYATRSPGDDDYDKAGRYFKKYVKPVLVAAGIDWEITNGTKHGGLARELQARIHERRRKLLGLEPWDETSEALGQPITPFSLSPQQELQRELDGGVVLVGRPALKEWAWALKHGWGTPVEVAKIDRDDLLAKELAEDHVFDEIPDEKENEMMSEKDKAIAALAADAEEDGAGAPLSSSSYRPGSVPHGPNAFISAFKGQSAQAAQTKEKVLTEAEKLAARLDPKLLEPPSQIPAQPPICFVDFTNLVGWRNIPLRMYQFFRQRDKVLHGAELGLQIVYGTKETAREFQAGRPGSFVGEVPDSPPQGGDLDWGLESEEKYTPYFLKTEKNISESKESYYKALPQHLKDTRDLTRGLREPSRLEKSDPPKTEMELREQRFEKEKEWRNSLMGFNIVRPEKGVEWDERWRGSIRVFDLSPEERARIDAEQKERQALKRAQQEKEKEEAAVSRKADETDLAGSRQAEL